MTKGYRHTEEAKRKISKAQKGNKNFYGKHHSEEAKRKMSLAHEGYKHTEEAKKKISISHSKENNSFWGKKHTKETRIKISLAHKGFKHTEETKRKICEHRAKQIFPINDTSIEVKIQDYLKQLGIPFFTHQYINIKHGYQCDILIPSLKIVIECDGDYWHKYPTRRDIDNIRTKELIEQGFKVLRLWECEIKIMDINSFEKRLKC